MSELFLANATADILEERSAPSLSRWRIEVWGVEPNDYTFVYEISAKNEKEAVQEGFKRFNEDVGQLLAQEAQKCQ